jgi:hypothetical protein
MTGISGSDRRRELRSKGRLRFGRSLPKTSNFRHFE